MDIFDGRYYKINKYFLSAAGLWPYQIGAIQLFTFAITIFGFISLLIPQIVFILKFRGDLDNLLSSIPTSISAVLVLPKIVALRMYAKRFKSLLIEIHDDWDLLSDDLETEILQKHAENGRRITVGYITLVLIPVSIYLSTPLATIILDIILPLNESRPKILPHPAEYFLDQDKYYFILLLDEYVAYFTAIAIVVGSDTMYIILMEHTCGMFAILSYRIENICDMLTIKSEKGALNEEELAYSYVTKCIQLHVKTLKFANLATALFTTYLLFDIGLGIFTHSAACAMIVIKMDQPDILAKYITIACAQSLRLFFNSFPGQRLTDFSAGISTAVYNAAWYDIPEKAKRVLLLLIMRSQTPCAITVAGLYAINLDSFGMVIKASVSYCTIMASIHDSDT